MLFFTVLVISLNSCSDDSKLIETNEFEGDKFELSKVNDEEALNAIQLLKEFDNSSIEMRQGLLLQEDLAIKNIVTKTYAYEVDESIVKQSSVFTLANEKKSFNLYTISFEKEGKKGFSIVAGDGRLSQIYAYTENGQIADTTHNIALAFVLSRIPDLCMYQLDDYYTVDEEEQVSLKSSSYQSIGPLVTTEWHQSMPFNNLYPSGSCSTYGGRYPAGCVPVAFCQAVAYFDPPLAQMNGRFNFPALTQYSLPSYSYEQMAADFVYYVGNRVLVSKTCNGSSAYLSGLFPLLSEWKLNYSYHKGNMSARSLTSTIMKKGVVIAGGTRKTDNVGHAWVICGLRGEVKNVCGNRSCGEPYEPVNNNNILYYCNWGWSDTNDNGWYNWALIEHPRSKPAAYLANNDQIFIKGVSNR